MAKKNHSRKHQSAKKHRSRKRSLALNKNFVSRFIVGVAAVFLIGFAVMFTMYLRNDIIDITGAKKERAAKNNEVSQPTAPAAVDVKISDDDHIRGNQDAKITIIGFADFQCPYSLKFYNVMKLVMDDYPGEVRWVYRHFPVRSHKYARKAAEASECAGEQDKFWEFSDKLFENQKEIGDDYISSVVKEIGLDASRFEDCLSGGKYADKVNDDYSQGKEAGVTGSPGFIINGELINGAVSYEEIRKKIEKY